MGSRAHFEYRSIFASFGVPNASGEYMRILTDISDHERDAHADDEVAQTRGKRAPRDEQEDEHCDADERQQGGEELHDEDEFDQAIVHVEPVDHVTEAIVGRRLP